MRRVAQSLFTVVVLSFVTPTVVSAVASPFVVQSYDLAFAVDPASCALLSDQVVELKHATDRAHTALAFLLTPEYEIELAELRVADNGELLADSWRSCEVHSRRGVFQNVEMETTRPVQGDERLVLHLVGRVGLQSVVEATTVPCSIACFSIEAGDGHVPMFSDADAAPFRLALRYPSTYVACASGRKDVSKVDGRFVRETFSRGNNGRPAFSVGAYRKVERRESQTSATFFLPPGHPEGDPVADVAFQVLRLYRTHFGDAGSNLYRVGGASGPAAWAVFSDDWRESPRPIDPAQSMSAWNPGQGPAFVARVARECFKNWNLGSVSWTGPGTEWFVDGGARFASAWAVERLMGADAGLAVRRSMVRRCGGDPASTLAADLFGATTVSVPDRGTAFEALAWEQLRRRVGDTALIEALADLFRQHRFRRVGIDDLQACVSARSDLGADQFLEDWTKRSGTLDLSIVGVKTVPFENGVRTEVQISLTADEEYEVFSEIGYRTDRPGPLTLVDLMLCAGKVSTVAFESEKPPQYIELDPRARVPQVDTSNDLWEAALADEPVGRGSSGGAAP